MTQVGPSLGRVTFSAEGAIGRVTLDNPRRRNALTAEMLQSISQIVDKVEKSSALRVVILRGEGRNAFCSGMDISSISSGEESQTNRLELIHCLRSISVPVIALVHGYCFGAGLLLALDADIRIAAASAQFAIPAAKLGLGYAPAEVERLVNLVGDGAASRMLFTASAVDAETARRSGLVDDVVDGEQADARADAMAHLVAANAPLSVRAAKAAIQHSVRRALGEKTDLEEINRRVRECLSSSDLDEGKAAFLEHRTPAFRGC